MIELINGTFNFSEDDPYLNYIRSRSDVVYNNNFPSTINLGRRIYRTLYVGLSTVIRKGSIELHPPENYVTLVCSHPLHNIIIRRVLRGEFTLDRTIFDRNTKSWVYMYDTECGGWLCSHILHPSSSQYLYSEEYCGPYCEIIREGKERIYCDKAEGQTIRIYKS